MTRALASLCSAGLLALLLSLPSCSSSSADPAPAAAAGGSSGAGSAGSPPGAGGAAGSAGAAGAPASAGAAGAPSGGGAAGAPSGGGAAGAPASGGAAGAPASGGAAGGAGTAGGSAGGGSAGGPASCAGLLYCEDFEGYSGPVADKAMLGPWSASVGGTMTTMAVDGVMPHSGARSLHITVAAGAPAHGTLNQKAAAGLIPGNNLFGRAMVYYAGTNGDGLAVGVHSWLFNAQGTSTAGNGAVSMNLGGGGAKLQLNYHPPAPLKEQSVQGGMITTGQWHCVQWQYDGSGTPPADAATVWVDGAVAVSAPASKGWNFATPWSAFAFGFTHYQTLMNGVDIYLDDFALSGAMIACP